MRPPNNTRILLVCEGEKDELFFRRFIDANNLHHLGICIWPSHGNSKFAEAIIGFEAEYGPKYRLLRAVLIVADKNDAADERLESVYQQIEQIHGEGSRPTGIMEPSNSGQPRIYVLMLPTHQDAGHLESQCIHAARRADAAAATMTDAVTAVAHADQWNSQSRRDKHWLRTNLTLRGLDAFRPLGDAFHVPRFHGLIPATDGAFAGVLEALQRLP